MAKRKRPAHLFKKDEFKDLDLSSFEFTLEDLIAGLADPVWRLSNLYKIVDKKTNVVTFRPNNAQKKLIKNLHNRVVILKARKMGFSTFIQLLMLDTALFSLNVRGKVIAQDRETAEGIFRDVFKFAYQNLPKPFQDAQLVETDPSKSQILFRNGSVVEVTTSARGTTPTFLHISEFGPIAANDPRKADEIVTGSLTSVAEDGLIFVESTAAGQEGEFYNLVNTARKLEESGKPLWKLDFRFIFFGWWEEPTYVAPVDSVVIPKKDQEYFDQIEVEIKRLLTPEQRAWYVKYRDSSYSGDQEKMYREMPSTPDEAFKISLEGAYFKDQFISLRKEQRITYCPYDPHYAVSLFFDIGSNDLCSVWAIQPRGAFFAVINYYEASGEPFTHFVNLVDSWGYVLGYVYLPHDANHRRQGIDRNMTPEEMLATAAPHWRFQLVARTPDKMMAITQTRNFLPLCIFDAVNCDQGLKHLQQYRKEYNARTKTYRNTPKHGPESNAADAFMQAAQANANGFFNSYSGGMAGMFGNEFGGSYPEPPNLDF